MTLTGAVLLAGAYLGLADADFSIPGGDRLRTRFDHFGWTVFRPVMSPAEMDGRSRSIRSTLRRRLLDGVAAREVEREQPISPWLVGQVVGAAFRDPNSQPNDLKPVLRLFDLVFGPPGTEPPDESKLEIGRAEHKFWTIMALSAVLARPELLDRKETDRLKQYLRIAQQRADAHYPLGDGGWNTAPRQADPANHFTYTSGLALHALLELHGAGLGWHDSRERLMQMIAETSRWLNGAFVSDNEHAGWRSNVDDDRPPESGTTLFVHAALGRACAEAGIPIASNARRGVDFVGSLRRRGYDSADPDIRFDVRVPKAAWRLVRSRSRA